MESIKISLRELSNLVKNGQGVCIKTDKGFYPLKVFHDNGRKLTRRVTTFRHQTVLATEEHKFYNEKGQHIFVSDLKEGDKILTETGVEQVSTLDENLSLSDVADLEIDHPDHRFYANGILVSNCSSQQEISHLSSKNKHIARVS